LTAGVFKYLPALQSGQDEKILNQLFRDTVYRDYAEGRRSVEEFYKTFCERAGLNLDFSSFKKEWNAVFTPMVGMDKIVQEVSKLYKLGLLSDIGPLHWEYLKKEIALLKNFNNPVLSYRIGYLKPHPQTYLLAADSVETLPEQCLFIDDREVNVKGAQKTGMQAIQFKNPKQLRRDLKTMHIL
jgi:putative hydrolase of the HAD superfamily